MALVAARPVAREGMTMTTAEPKDRLSDEIIKTLRQFGIPHEGLIRNSDLVRAKLFRHKDFHQQARLKALGFPPGRWLGANTKVYTPEEVGTYLLNLPTERPVLPQDAKPRAAAAKAKTATKQRRMVRR
jgi:hypothetical protein